MKTEMGSFSTAHLCFVVAICCYFLYLRIASYAASWHCARGLNSLNGSLLRDGYTRLESIT